MSTLPFSPALAATPVPVSPALPVSPASLVSPVLTSTASTGAAPPGTVVPAATASADAASVDVGSRDAALRAVVGGPATVAWIAGVGASAGIGAAAARRFARAGSLVVISGRTPERLERVAQEIRAAGGEVEILPLDLTDAEAVEAAGRAVARFGSLAVAVFNAGAMVRAPALDLLPAQFEDAWRVGTYGGFVFARAALLTLLSNGLASDHPNGRGSLIFTGATAALRGRPPFAAFAAAKAGLRSLAQSLAREFGPQGIHVVHAVIDGGVDGARLRSHSPARFAAAAPDGLLSPEAIAEAYWQLHRQHRSAWSQEIDLRPYREAF